MGARICPRCSTHVDERRAKTSPFCLRCGAALGNQEVQASPSPTFSGKAPAGGGSALPLLLGVGGVLALLGIGAVVVLIALSSSDPPATPEPAVVTAVAAPRPEAPAADGGIANGNATPSGTVKGGGTVGAAPRPPTTATPFSTATPRIDAGPAVLGPFPRAKAQAEVDRVGSTISSCKKTVGPFGGSSIRVDFEPDGRVGTVTRPPFAGTPEGSCISAKFLAIKIGPFIGTTQSIEHGFIIQD